MENKVVCRVCNHEALNFNVQKTECSSDDIFYDCTCINCGRYLMSGFSSLLISKHTISVDIAKFRTENLSANKEGRQVAWVNSAFTYSNKLKDSFVNSKADIRLIEDIAILNER